MSSGLDKFQEATLKNGLRRRTFRPPDSSSHFASNPLLHRFEPNKESDFSDSSELAAWQNLARLDSPDDKVSLNPLCEDSNPHIHVSLESKLLLLLPTFGGMPMYRTFHHTFWTDLEETSDEDHQEVAALNLNYCCDHVQVTNFAQLKAQTFGGIKGIDDAGKRDVSRLLKPPTFRSLSDLRSNSAMRDGKCEYRRKRNKTSALFDAMRHSTLSLNDELVICAQQSVGQEMALMDEDVGKEQKFLKLEPPVIPEVIERRFVTLSELCRDFGYREK